MLNPDFIARVRAKLDHLVEGGADAERDQALDALAEQYSQDFVDPANDPIEYRPICDWIVGNGRFSDMDIHEIAQRDFLLALDPEAAPEIAKMKNILSTDLWVEVATKKLAPYAQERILDEIQAHYREALEEEIADGAPAVHAHLEMIERLGDPRTAGKVFRKTYLTQTEAKRLGDLYAPFRRIAIFGRHTGTIVFTSNTLFFFWTGISHVGAYSSSVCAAAFILVWFINRSLVMALIRRRHGRRAFAWQVSSIIFFLVVFWSEYAEALRGEHPVTQGVLILAALGLGLWLPYHNGYLYRKTLPDPVASLRDLSGR